MDTQRKVTIVAAALLLSLIAVLAFGISYYGPPITALVETRLSIRQAPWVWIVPTPLPDPTVWQSPGKVFTYAGYQFEAPWTEVKLEKKGDAFGVVEFKNGVTIVLVNESPTPTQIEQANKSGMNLKALMGYQMYAAMLNATPADLRILSTRRNILRYSFLLQTKCVLMPPTNGHLYSFQTQWTRGFQAGETAQVKGIVIVAFDGADNKIRLVIGTAPGAGKPTQQEVNRVLFSLRPAPASAPAN